MTENPRPEHLGDEPVDTGSLDTEAFRAFATREEPSPARSGVPFRLMTLAIGLAAFVAIAVLLLR